MSKFEKGDTVVAKETYKSYLTKGKEYTVIYDQEESNLVTVLSDRGLEDDLYAYRVKLKEEEIVNEVETKQEFFRSTNNHKIYSVAFKGESLTVLKDITSGSELVCHNDNIPSYMFESCSDEDVKAIAKQAKKNEDLGTLANVTDEIRKLLDDNHVICHANVNRDTKGLVEFNIMLGESV